MVLCIIRPWKMMNYHIVSIHLAAKVTVTREDNNSVLM